MRITATCTQKIMLPEVTVESVTALSRQLFPPLLLIVLVTGPGLLLLRYRKPFPLWLALAAPLAMTLAGLAYNLPYTNDDAFIFLRYARNLSQGFGPVYNVGQPTEGFTSPLWTALLTIGMKIMPVLPWAKILGGLLTCVAVVTMGLSGRKLLRPDEGHLLHGAMIIVVASQLFWSWSISGMDVPLFLAWESLFIYQILRRPEPSLGLWVLTAIGPWMRPEAVLIVVLGWLWLAWPPAGMRRSTWLLRGLLLLAILIMPLVGRHVVFHDWLPNTFYAKSDRTVRNGIGFLLGAVNEFGPLIWALALIGAWSIRRRYGFVVLLIAGLAGAFVLVGGDLLTQRFSVFWLPCFVVGIVGALQLGARQLGQAFRPLLLLIVLLVCVRGAFQAYQIVKPTAQPGGYGYVSSNSVALSKTDAPIGWYLAAHAYSNDRVLTDNIGALGYYSGLHIIDANGLVDSRAARLLRDGNTDALRDYFQALQPEWIVGYVADSSRGPRYGLNRPGMLGQWVDDEYERIGVWQSGVGYSRVLLHRALHSREQ